MAVQPLKAVFEWVLRTMMKDQTGIVQTMPKKDRLIDKLNKNLKKQRKKTKAKPEQEPYNLEKYQDIMTSDFEKKTGPYFDKLKKLKGKK